MRAKAPRRGEPKTRKKNGPPKAPLPESPTDLERRLRARLPPIDLDAVKRATTHDERGIAAMRLLVAGRWDLETVTELAASWNVTIPTMMQYRRTGEVAMAALGEPDRAKELELVKTGFQLMRDETRAIAMRLEAAGRYVLAPRYRDLERKAAEDFARMCGLGEVRHSISIEQDPRIAGLMHTLKRAAEDFDRMRATFLEEVQGLTSGVLPKAPLPEMLSFLVDVIHRYETEIGARGGKVLPP